MPEFGSQSSFSTNFRVKEPDMYEVLMLNDDFTTMDFVVEVLRTVFFCTSDEAERLMIDIHQKGSAVVGMYTFDIARSKVYKAEQLARESNFPLRLKLRKKG